MIYDLFDIDMPFELVGVSRSTELVLRFNSAGHMWESEMLPVECIMVREVEHVLDVPASSKTSPTNRTSTMEGLDEGLMVAPN